MNQFQVLYYRQQQYAKALPLAEQVLKGCRKLFGDDEPRTLIAQASLADNLCKLKRYDEAEELYRKAAEGQDHVLGRDHPFTRGTLMKVAAMYDAWGKPDKAAEWRAKLPEDKPQ